MADAVTKPTDVDVDAYLASIEHATRRADGEALREMMSRVAGEPAVMWGPTMIGFGVRHYAYDSGRTGTTFLVGFAPRKTGLVVYGVTETPEAPALLAELGKHRQGASCLYITKLADIDQGVLVKLIEAAHRAPAGAGGGG